MTNDIFKKQPYFDDFDKLKGFEQVLFKPSVPVQARELNQVQSILHNQTNTLAEHIFKKGTRVNGQAPTWTITPYITLDNLSPFDGLTVNLDRIKGAVKLKGQTSGIEAILLNSVPTINGDPVTLYVKYILTAIDNKTTVFLDGEIVDVIDINGIVSYSFKVRCPTCEGSNDLINLNPTGKGILWQIPDSTYYTGEYFVDVSATTVIGEKYTNGIDSYTVGLDIVYEVVTSDDDSSLYDNALGYPNYMAPGADRYKITLVPIVRTTNVEDGENFITLAKVVKGVVTFILSKTQYADLMDMLAERTYDESGNYTVIPFKVHFKEHLALSANDSNGVYQLSEGGDENKLVAIVSEGKAYVKGFQVEKITESLVDFEKARDTRKVNEYYNKLGSLNYVIIKPVSTSSFFPTDINLQSLFTTEIVNLYDGVPSGGLPTGSIIGTFTPYDVEYHKGTGANTEYKLYFSNITMNVNKTYDMVKSLSYSSTVLFLANVVNDDISGKPKVYNSNQTSLIWDIGKQNVKSLRDINNSTQNSLTYTVRRKHIATLNGSGQYTWTTGTGEFFDSYSSVYTLVGYVNNDNTFTRIDVTTELTVNPSSMTINMGALNSGKKVIVIQNIIKTNSLEKTKSLSTQIITNSVLTLGKIETTKTDLHQVISIFKFNPLTPSIREDVKEHFTWNSGATDVAYVPIIFTKKSTAPSWSGSDNFEITFKYYEHSSTGDYFNVDSYSAIVNDNTITYSYGDIPSYTTTNGQVLDLKSCLDFRPDIVNNLPINKEQPSLNGTYNTDYEIYLPRTDLLVIDKDGNIYQKKGISSDFPVQPRITDDREMPIYTITMNAYVYNIQNDVKFKFIENKRYTMRDIGKIDARVQNVEYYTAFTLVESKTADMSIKDANGLDRFKNGFIVDNFQNYQAADLENVEFKASLDRKYNELRPQYSTLHSELEFDTNHSVNYKQVGDVIMINYDEELFINQPFSSKHLSVNPYYIFNQAGKLLLNPSFDNWANTTTKPTTNVSIDTGIDAITKIANNSGLLGIQYGAWSDINSTVINSSITDLRSTDPFRSSNAGWLQRVDTLANTQQRSVTNNTLESRKNSYDLGERVTDVKITPYIRSKDIQFHGTGLKPNTRVYCFFDGVNVTANCKPLKSGLLGSPIIVDSKGIVSGIFRIPSNRFFTGQKTFRITNDINNSTDEDLLETSAEAVYWAGGLDVTKESTTLNVVTPVLIGTPVGSGVETQTVTTQRRSEPYDPVAQTFTVDQDCFLTSIDVYFKQVDSGDKIFVQLKNTENGYPGPVILTEANINDTEVQLSEDAKLPTRINFAYPVYVQGNKDYAVVVGGNSPDTRLWISKLGQNDITNPNILIDKQPSLGSLFKSQNNKTWTPSQFEDLKYKLYRAKFKHNTLTVSLTNTPLLNEYNVTNPIETESGSNIVRIHIKNHGNVIGDKIKLNIGEETWLNVSASTGQLALKHKIVTTTGSGIVKDIKTVQDGTVDVQLTDITGYFTATQSFTSASFTPNVSSNYLTSMFTRQSISIPVVNNVIGTINQTFNPLLNGIPINELNNEMFITGVDSANSVLVTTTTNANTTGRTGGTLIINSNKRYELFNISGSYTINNSSESWVLKGVGHSINGLFTASDYVVQPDVIFTPKDDNFLGKPFKFATKLNEDLFLSGNKSVNVVGTFTSNSEYTSPVINTETFSFVGVTNIIDNDTTLTYNVSPNATNRLIAETDKVSGTNSFKYVTKAVTLANPALDMKILLDVYKPNDTDFDLYIKYTAPTGDSNIDDIGWTLITGIDKNFINSDINKYTEIQYTLSEIMPNTFGSSEFNCFRFKIVGKAKNPATPPMFKTLRLIAIT